jgi:hypothetical protein
MDFSSFAAKPSITHVDKATSPGIAYFLNLSVNLSVDNTSLQATSAHSVIEILAQSVVVLSTIYTSPTLSHYSTTLRISKSLLQMQYNATNAPNKLVSKQEDPPLISITAKALQSHLVIHQYPDKKQTCNIFISLQKLKVPFQLTKVTRITAILQV